MADNLYPIIYKPGIKKDGTLFQSEYCTNGFWVRFQNGMIKKIGGMKSAPRTVNINDRINTIFAIPDGDQLYCYMGGSINIYSVRIDKQFNNAAYQVPLVPNQNNVMWNVEKVIDKTNNVPYLAFLATNNLSNIFDDSQAKLFRAIPATPGTVQNDIPNINPSANGGLVYAEPYLFIYGSNGYVQYSAFNDPFDFDPNNANVVAANRSSNFSISASDKIIYGAQIRGGTYSPTLLFWTLRALILARNVGEDQLVFKSEKISDITIMSSKCVIEDSGVFYWIGTDDFYVFTGVVNRIPNPLNKRYFFDNVDMNKRQMIYAVKNDRREILWPYPEKANAGDPNIGCTRAVVYNIPENTWFDTPIYRDAAFYSKEFGLTLSYGKPITGLDTNNYLWLHEIGFNQQRWNSNTNLFVQEDIISYFTTPFFSWTAFNPLKQATGTDKWVILKRLEPDFKSSEFYKMQLTVNTRKYPQSAEVNYGPYDFAYNTDKINLNVQGRNMTLTFASPNDFEMGHVLTLLGVGDTQ